jgi:hypothetical protein
VISWSVRRMMARSSSVRSVAAGTEIVRAYDELRSGPHPADPAG